MILADTSVWADHLRKSSQELSALLNEGLIVCHPFVIGELACGNMRNREEILYLFLRTSQPLAQLTHREQANAGDSPQRAVVYWRVARPGRAPDEPRTSPVRGPSSLGGGPDGDLSRRRPRKTPAWTDQTNATILSPAKKKDS